MAPLAAMSEASKTSLRRRAKLAGLVLAVAGVSFLGAWIGVNVYPYEAPAPLWTAADLPAPPPPGDNGWTVLPTTRLDVDIPEDLEELRDFTGDETPAAYWSKVDGQGDALAAFLAKAQVREANARVDEIRARPNFVSTCDPLLGLDGGETCNQLVWLQHHKLAELRALDLARRGQDREALALVADLVRVDRSHLDSANNLLTVFVALANLEHSLGLAKMIALQPDLPESAEPAVAAVAAELDGFDARELDLQHVLVGEYLVHTWALDAVDGRNPRAAAELGREDQFLGFYSRALTLREVNARFETRREAAERGDLYVALGGDQPSVMDEFGWWFRNPAGKRVLEAMRFEPTDMSQDLDERLETLAALAEALRARAR